MPITRRTRIRSWSAAVLTGVAVVALTGCDGAGEPAGAASTPAVPAATGPAATSAPAVDADGLRPAPLRAPARAGDEFAGTSLTGWRLAPGEVVDGAAPRVSVAGGMLTMVSAHSSWFQTSHGLGLARRTTGDFVATLRVRPSGVHSAVPTVDWSLTGLMVRAPTSDPAAENWVHLSAGYVGRPVVERKNTVNTHSELVVRDAAAGWIELRIVRSRGAVVLLYRSPGGPWTFDHTYLRPDLPPTVELLLTTQSGAESDHADLVSTVDWLRLRPVRLSAAVQAALVEGDRSPPAAVLAALTG